MVECPRFVMTEEYKNAEFVAVPSKLETVFELWRRDPMGGFMDPTRPEKPGKLNHWLRILDAGGEIAMPAVHYHAAVGRFPSSIMVEDGRHRLAALFIRGVPDIVVALGTEDQKEGQSALVRDEEFPSHG